jgi:hypothetical protein
MTMSQALQDLLGSPAIFLFGSYMSVVSSQFLMQLERGTFHRFLMYHLNIGA